MNLLITKFDLKIIIIKVTLLEVELINEKFGFINSHINEVCNL